MNEDLTRHPNEEMEKNNSRVRMVMEEERGRQQEYAHDAATAENAFILALYRCFKLYCNYLTCRVVEDGSMEIAEAVELTNKFARSSGLVDLLPNWFIQPVVTETFVNGFKYQDSELDLGRSSGNGV